MSIRNGLICGAEWAPWAITNIQQDCTAGNEAADVYAKEAAASRIPDKDMYSYLAAERTSAASRKRRAAERATQNGRMAVLDFLRDTKVGCMVSLAPPVEGSEAEEEIPGPPGPD